MIIFGFRTRSSVLATLLLTCQKCSTPAAHHVGVIRRWFTLFFIPVIPFSTKRITKCTMCGSSSKIDKLGSDRLVSAAKANAMPAAPPKAVLPSPDAFADAPSPFAPDVRAPETVTCRFCGAENDISEVRCSDCGKRPRALQARASSN